MTATRILRGQFEVDELPEKSLVLLIGTSGSGKSTLVRRLFKTTQIVSSDRIRGWISDNEGDQTVTAQAFEILHQLVRLRLELGRTTVVDATNVSHASRVGLLRLARTAGRPAVALVCDVDADTSIARDARRRGRRVGRDVIEVQRQQFESSRAGLAAEGFVEIRILSADDIDAMVHARSPKNLRSRR